MDIAVWLKSLGLGRYDAAFRENDIDEAVLPSLTHENLKELGVTSLGHRVKLLDAIAALRNETSAQTPSVTAVKENAVALSLVLTSEELQTLDAAYPPPSR
jgi:SAM domain (Sterile alpha motif)